MVSKSSLVFLKELHNRQQNVTLQMVKFMTLSMFQALIPLCPVPVSDIKPIPLFFHRWDVFLTPHLMMGLLYCISETQTLPPVQVFDKTMAVKQMHILEPQDLLITRADKGRLERNTDIVLPADQRQIFFFNVLSYPLTESAICSTCLVSLCSLN